MVQISHRPLIHLLPAFGCGFYRFWGVGMANDPRSPFQDPTLAILNHRVEAMHDDVSELRAVLKELSVAITRLALVEERQGQSAEAQERAFKVLETLERRVTALENRVPETDRTKIWMDRAVLAIIFSVFVFVAKKVGLL
jgi:uncharacterized coiled-coil protein SlyX